jgi:hypothetical protein
MLPRGLAERSPPWLNHPTRPPRSYPLHGASNRGSAVSDSTGVGARWCVFCGVLIAASRQSARHCGTPAERRRGVPSAWPPGRPGQTSTGGGLKLGAALQPVGSRITQGLGAVPKVVGFLLVLRGDGLLLRRVQSMSVPCHSPSLTRRWVGPAEAVKAVTRPGHHQGRPAALHMPTVPWGLCPPRAYK